MLYDRRDFGLLRLAGAYQWLPLVPLRALSPLKQLCREAELLAALGLLAFSRNNEYLMPSPEGYQFLSAHDLNYQPPSKRPYTKSPTLRRRLEVGAILLTCLGAGIEPALDKVERLKRQPVFLPAFALRTGDGNLMNAAGCAGFGHWGDMAYMVQYVSENNPGFFMNNELVHRELVERVCQSKTLMEVARHLGCLKELISGKQKNSYAYSRGEKYSIELGGDINRALGSEFAMLAAPEALPLFLRKLQRKGLKQYQRREPVSKGSGDIICMLDESGSAEQAAPWCKAVALALLNVAMQGKRRFAMIHFSSVDKFQTDLFIPGQYDREDVFKAAETFLGGNTDYATPLKEALRLMEQEGFENADMVFVTDGACNLPDSFLTELKEKRAQRRFQITGVLLDQNAAGFSFSLEPFCTEILRTSELTQENIAARLLSERV